MMEQTHLLLLVLLLQHWLVARAMVKVLMMVVTEVLVEVGQVLKLEVLELRGKEEMVAVVTPMRQLMELVVAAEVQERLGQMLHLAAEEWEAMDLQIYFALARMKLVQEAVVGVEMFVVLDLLVLEVQVAEVQEIMEMQPLQPQTLVLVVVELVIPNPLAQTSLQERVALDL
jgi:hypothetical protein